MNYSEFIDHASLEEIINELSRLVQIEGRESIDAIVSFLTYTSHDVYYKHAIPRQACKALIQKGPDGIDALYSLVVKGMDGFTYPATIINSIWFASQGDMTSLKFFSIGEDTILDRPLNEITILAAKEAFCNLIASCINDCDLFYILIGALHEQMIINPAASKLIAAVVDSITNSSIRITKKKLEEFAQLIEAYKREEEYQIFLKNNPAFIDPLSSQVIDKHKLGDDLITDFVIKTLENNYILVEIEKPQDHIFNKNNDFSASFIHAYGQVLDFISWVDGNVAYAQKKLPNISAPNGILIMGRSTLLTADQRKKLEYFNLNSARIKIYTYDDILINAKRLYQNLIYSHSN